MATAPKLLRALVDYYQGGAKVYAAGNLYPESDALLLMKARGEAEVPKTATKAKVGRSTTDVGDKTDVGAADTSQPADQDAISAQPEQGDPGDAAASDAPQP